ncbi:MAG: pantetheine-phosphate adenylyltransferase [Lachnospiraceae bacterium]|jgi:pantetheine-phosphate adenylyltransferase|nr:pantetheine-phosphate adenylyltransferase [Lachnospiraceae bacterium]
MVKAIYPGSFDPVTNGHIDIIRRASGLFDKLYVGVLSNSSKNPLFSIDNRVTMIKEAVGDIANVEVVSYDGLLVDYCKNNGITAIVRGLRAITDFDYELQIAQTNKVMEPEVDTVFLTTSLEYAYLSSSIVKEIASYHGNIDKLVPSNVKCELEAKYI